MRILDQTWRLREESREICSRFVEIELDLALTFYQIATKPKYRTEHPLDREKVQRNLDQANRAFESAYGFVRRLQGLGETIPLKVWEKLEQVGAALGRTTDH